MRWTLIVTSSLRAILFAWVVVVGASLDPEHATVPKANAPVSEAMIRIFDDFMVELL
jgi:hypothetical protein